MKKRTEYFDTVRLLAALFIFTTYFIAFFEPDIFKLWDEVFVTSLFLNGVTGKLCVTLFCVILGYFAMIKGLKNAENPKEQGWKYLVERYLYFLIAGLIIHTAYYLFSRFALAPYQVSIADVFRSSVFLKDTIIKHWWSMIPFLIGSFVCYINGRYHVQLRDIAVEILICIYIGQIWVAICLMGNVMYILLQNEKITNILCLKRTRIIILAAIFVLIKRPENNTTFLIDGICMSAFMMMLCTWNGLQKVFNHKIWTGFNKYYMGVYMVHELIYASAGLKIVQGLLSVPYKIRLPLAYLVSLILTLVCAKLIMHLVNFINRAVISRLNKIVYRERKTII